MLYVQTVENAAGRAQMLWHMNCRLNLQEGALPQCPLPICFTVKSPLQHWNTSQSLDLHILITSIWWASIRICDLSNLKWTENLSRNLLKNTLKESKSMQLFSFHSSATSAATAWGVWELHSSEGSQSYVGCFRLLQDSLLMLNKCPYIKSCSHKWNILLQTFCV